MPSTVHLIRNSLSVSRECHCSSSICVRTAVQVMNEAISAVGNLEVNLTSFELDEFEVCKYHCGRGTTKFTGLEQNINQVRFVLVI